MNSIFAVWFLSEKHSIYIEFLLQERLLSNRFFAYFHSHSCHRASKVFISEYFHFHSCHRASKVFFQKCSLSLPHSLLYILTRTIEHRKPPREPCHPKGLDLPLIQDDRVYPTTVWSYMKEHLDVEKSFDLEQFYCENTNAFYSFNCLFLTYNVWRYIHESCHWNEKVFRCCQNRWKRCESKKEISLFLWCTVNAFRFRWRW